MREARIGLTPVDLPPWSEAKTFDRIAGAISLTAVIALASVGLLTKLPLRALGGGDPRVPGMVYCGEMGAIMPTEQWRFLWISYASLALIFAVYFSLKDFQARRAIKY